MPFAHGPVLTTIGDGRYTTIGTTEYVGGTDRITIPDGFATDLASVPRLFWAFIPPTGAYSRAAVLHDWLCVELFREHQEARNCALLIEMNQMIKEEYPGVAVRWVGAGSHPSVDPAPVSACDADGLFRRVMRESGVGLLTRWVMWCGVRWGALANPARRAGWWRDAPAVLGISALVLAPVALLTAAVVEGVQ